MKKIFLLFIFFQVLVFASDNVIGTIIFNDRNYFVHDKNEKKKEVKKKEVKRGSEVKLNLAQKQIAKSIILKKRGVNFLVWADRIEKNDRVMDTLLQFNSKELPKIRGFTIAASRDYTFIHSKTGLLFISSKSDKNKLLKYLNKNTTKKRISRKKVYKNKVLRYKKNNSYAEKSNISKSRIIKDKKVKLYKDRTGFEYTLYK